MSGVARAEREAVLSVPSVGGRIGEEDRRAAMESNTLPHALHEALLEALYASGADLLILPIQDAFGWRDRINQPGTVGEANWTWRLPWPADQLRSEPEAMAVASQLQAWTKQYGR